MKRIDSIKHIFLVLISIPILLIGLPIFLIFVIFGLLLAPIAIVVNAYIDAVEQLEFENDRRQLIDNEIAGQRYLENENKTE